VVIKLCHGCGTSLKMAVSCFPLELPIASRSERTYFNTRFKLLLFWQFLFCAYNFLSVRCVRLHWRCSTNCWKFMRFCWNMDAIWWGTRGTCPPTFLDGGDIICYVPPHFSQVLFGDISKINVTFVTNWAHV